MQITLFSGLVLALLAALAGAVGLVWRRFCKRQPRLMHAIETLDQGFALFDREDRLVMANRAYRDLFPMLADLLKPGATYRELLQASAERVLYSDAVGREAEWIQERMAHHCVDDQPLVQHLADGRWIYLVERTTPEGERVGLRIDVSQLKAREQALAESEARYRDLVEGSIQAIIIQVDWRLLFANRAAAQMLGYASVDALHRASTLEDLIAPHDRARVTSYYNAWTAGEPVPTRYEVDLLRRDGEGITCDCMTRAIQWQGRPAVQATLIDITERKRAERALRRHQEALEARVDERTQALSVANQELEAFVYSVSHDLRAPLRHIRGFAQALEEDCATALDAAGEEYLERLQGAVGRMERLIDDLLDLSRLSRTELQRQPVDLSWLAREVVAEMRHGQRDDRPVEISIEEGLEASGDPGLLRVLLQNLFGNAVKYTRYEPEPRIALRSQGRAGSRHFCIEDNGVGFDMAYADRLFGPFQRLHAERDFAGDGIGLATVARIVHRHGGVVWAHGEAGAGAMFHFTLPDSDDPGGPGMQAAE